MSASLSFARYSNREGRKILIRADPPGGFAISRIDEYHPPRKRDDPLFRPIPSINPLATRDQPVRTVQLSRGSSPSLNRR